MSTRHGTPGSTSLVPVPCAKGVLPPLQNLRNTPTPTAAFHGVNGFIVQTRITCITCAESYDVDPLVCAALKGLGIVPMTVMTVTVTGIHNIDEFESIAEMIRTHWDAGMNANWNRGSVSNWSGTESPCVPCSHSNLRYVFYWYAHGEQLKALEETVDWRNLPKLATTAFDPLVDKYKYEQFSEIPPTQDDNACPAQTYTYTFEFVETLLPQDKL